MCEVAYRYDTNTKLFRHIRALNQDIDDDLLQVETRLPATGCVLETRVKLQFVS